jgi:hypothetical protein
MREKKWTASRIFPLLEQKAVKGEHWSSFCEQHSISKSTYFYWHSRWKESKKESSGGFVPVHVNADSDIVVLELREGLRLRLYPQQLPEVLSILGYAG